MKERAAFEAWVKETNYSTDWSRAGGPDTGGEYLKPRVADAWKAWQAAAKWAAANDIRFRAALERIADKSWDDARDLKEIARAALNDGQRDK